MDGLIDRQFDGLAGSKMLPLNPRRKNSIAIQFEARPKLQEFEMAIHPIYRRRLSDLKITVWNARDNYEEDLSVKITSRHRSTKPFSTFSLKDLQAASLLIQDVIEMFEPSSPRIDRELD